MPSFLPFESPRSPPGRALPGMIKGYHGWRDNARASRRQPAPAAPAAMVIAGADLATDPLTLFRAPAGALYVVRAAAPLVPPYVEGRTDLGTAAAVEFAITILGIGDIVVLGHSGAAMTAALLGHADRFAALMNQGVQIPGWFTLAEEALARSLRPGIAEADRPRALAQEMIRCSVENLMGYAWVMDGVLGGQLGLHGWYFDETARSLARLDPESDEFVPI